MDRDHRCDCHEHVEDVRLPNNPCDHHVELVDDHNIDRGFRLLRDVRRQDFGQKLQSYIRPSDLRVCGANDRWLQQNQYGRDAKL